MACKNYCLSKPRKTQRNMVTTENWQFKLMQSVLLVVASVSYYVSYVSKVSTSTRQQVKRMAWHKLSGRLY